MKLEQVGGVMPTYDDALSRYITDTFAHEDAALAAIRKQIPERGLPEIMIRPEEAAFLQFLVAAVGARSVVEIGTLGGYSGSWMARALPSDGKLITLEVEPKHADVAREHFALAGVADKVDIRLGDAHSELRVLSSEGPFDIVFIDAEKEGYLDYLDWALDNLRIGGVVAAHNAFRGGRLVAEGEQDPRVAIMRQFNQRLAENPDVLATIFPAGDGMALGVKRG
jgi:predicted O-methyltransferase YrrM